GESALEALTLGANDYATKPSNVGPLDHALAVLRDDLIPKVKQFFEFAGQPGPRSGAPLSGPGNGGHAPIPRHATAGAFGAAAAALRLAREAGPKKVLLIGSSTGGPTALAEIIPLLPANFRVPILMVQHMPPMFTRLLAERLQQQSKIRIEEASEGAVVEPGKAYIAPGDYHLGLR
ncbi:MAG: hypothetical protein JNL62_30320, partial [Bryobacterales bacterium]|nr:hypothetical protein [Bryobacterales bacterium]